MNTQDRVQMSTEEVARSAANQEPGNESGTKFAEPRGWALKWAFTQEMEHSIAEQVSENGDGTWEKFAEPRGWAMKWDGLALSEARKRQNEHDPSGR